MKVHTFFNFSLDILLLTLFSSYTYHFLQSSLKFHNLQLENVLTGHDWTVNVFPQDFRAQESFF